VLPAITKAVAAAIDRAVFFTSILRVRFEAVAYPGNAAMRYSYTALQQCRSSTS
jgi:hypothetical protein